MHLSDEEQGGEKDCNGSDGNSDEGDGGCMMMRIVH